MWHTMTAIPYGRIQFVDVESGPIARALGLKKLEIHTASTTSNSDLPGLPAAEADALRDRLAAKARERMSGL
nr:PH domain-containing protein [Corynebacterium aquatimens]